MDIFENLDYDHPYLGEEFINIFHQIQILHNYDPKLVYDNIFMTYNCLDERTSKFIEKIINLLDHNNNIDMMEYFLLSGIHKIDDKSFKRIIVKFLDKKHIMEQLKDRLKDIGNYILSVLVKKCNFGLFRYMVEKIGIIPSRSEALKFIHYFIKKFNTIKIKTLNFKIFYFWMKITHLVRTIDCQIFIKFPIYICKNLTTSTT